MLSTSLSVQWVQQVPLAHVGKEGETVSEQGFAFPDYGSRLTSRRDLRG